MAVGGSSGGSGSDGAGDDAEDGTDHSFVNNDGVGVVGGGCSDGTHKRSGNVAISKGRL